MPRYIVRMAQKRRYGHWASAPATATHDDLMAIAAATPKPDPWPADWRITSVGDLEIMGPPKLIDNEWGFRIYCLVEAENSIIVYAKNEKKAAELAREASPSWRDDNINSMCPGGWNDKETNIEILSIRRDPVSKPLKHSFEIEVDRLVASDRGWYPYELDQIFEVFRHFVRTGMNYEKVCTWHTQTIRHILSGSELDWRTDKWPSRIWSLKDLKRRFQHALLARGYDFYEDWRQAIGFKLGEKIKIEAPHRGHRYRDTASGKFSQVGLERAIQHMIEDSRGMKLAFSLNAIHTAAIEIQRIGILVGPESFHVVLTHGYPNDSSYWDFTIARSRGNEPFVETIERAYNLFRRLVPDFDQQDREKQDRKWGRRTQPEPELV